MAETITTSFIRQGSCGSTGDIRTCLRTGNTGSSSTCDIGGSGEGSSYQNTVLVRFDTLPANVASAKLTITYQQSGSSHWNVAQTITVESCANFNNNTNGTALPTRFGSKVTGSLAASTATITIDVTKVIQESLSNGSECLYIYANAADNRKRVNAITLEYEPIKVQLNGVAASSVTFNGQAVKSLIFNGTTIF